LVKTAFKQEKVPLPQTFHFFTDLRTEGKCCGLSLL